MTGLSLTLTNLVINGQSPDPAGDLRRADKLSQQAVGLDPNNAAAHALRARVLQAQRRQKEAAEEYRISLQINGNIPTTTLFLGETFVFTGKSLDAIPLFERAIELSPRDPGLGTWQFEMGRAMILLRRDDEALTWLSRSVATNPRLAYGQLYYAAIMAIKDDLSAARAALAEAGRLNPNYTSLARFRATEPVGRSCLRRAARLCGTSATQSGAAGTVTFRRWPISEVAPRLVEVRTGRHSGLDLLRLSSSHSDPYVWSGRALQEVSSTWQMRSCINVSGL
nr:MULTISPECIES: tetratricopeptide repeat protein [unclassified Bradyrhizobium]